MKKPTNRGKRFPVKTQRQELALKLIAEALKSRKQFSLAAVLRQAGYAPESVRQSTNIMQSLAPHIDPLVKRIEAHRDKILERMEKTVGKASYKDLARSLESTTKVARLLGGKSTSNLAIIHGERRRELDALLDDNETDEGED